MFNALRKANQQLLIIIAGCIVMGSLIFSINGSNERFVKNAALETARSYSETFTSIRTFYQQNVVERLQGTNAKVVHNFRELEGAVPIPATMMIELTAYLNQSNNDVTLALVSDYPFPWRANRTLVDFDEKALNFFRDTGGDEYHEFRVENDTTYLHYARPVLMSNGCVECHNSHPDSPKTDWKVGDVRAVQIFELPFDGAASEMSLETAIFVSVIIILSITTMFALLASNLRSQKAQVQLRGEAHFDSLTGAMRRPRFQDLYDHKNREKAYFLAIIDIDDFKSFNTDFGHAVGDKILREVVYTISQHAPDAEVLCRYGGEEFLLLIDRRLLKGSAQSYFNRLVEAIQQHSFSTDDRQIGVTISIGYRLLESGDNLTKCAERADAALRYAKRSGKNQAVEADQGLLQSLGYLDQSYRTSDIENALATGRLFFEFEPIVNVTDGTVVSYEALIRMQLPNNTIVPPSAFLPQYMSALRSFENTDHLRATLLASLDAAPIELKNTRTISFNLDPYDLVNNVHSNSLIVVLKELMSQGYNVAIEIVETPYMETVSEEKFVQNLNTLKEMGFLIYMDDFGKEGSSLQRFLSFSFDALKIDRSILIDLETSDKAKSLISVLVTMSQRSGFSIIVEGVETDAQERVLKALGVKNAQGYFYSKER